MACYRNISWSENFQNGLLNFLIHPFTPLHYNNFNYECLFSRKSYCCINGGICNRDEQVPQSALQNSGIRKFPISYITCFRKQLSSILQNLVGDIKSVEEGEHADIDKNWVGNSRQYFHIKNRWMFCTQLILCTVTLGYYLARDVKSLFSYVKYRLSYRRVN